MKTPKLCLLALAIVSALAGCVHTVVELPNNGGRFSRTSFLSNASIGAVTVKTAGPDAGVSIAGYNNKQTDVAAAALALAAASLKVAP